jgi:hypothetical protein
MLDHKVTSRGLRAFNVTMRRSHGVLDSQIAFEIGHTSGGQTLARVYGGVLPAWLEGKAPNAVRGLAIDDNRYRKREVRHDLFDSRSGAPARSSSSETRPVVR